MLDTRGVLPMPTANDTTQLTPEMEVAFRAWAENNGIRDVDMPDSNYDYRGAWLAGMQAGPDAHWPDTFKQHGHETFSNESQYAGGPYDAGHWEGDKYVPAPIAPPIDIDVTSPEFVNSTITSQPNGVLPQIDISAADAARRNAVRPYSLRQKF